MSAVDDRLTFLSPGFDRDRAGAALRDHGLDAVLLTSPENVFYASGYTVLPSAGNPILYTLRNRLPYFVIVTAEGRGPIALLGLLGRRGSVRG